MCNFCAIFAAIFVQFSCNFCAIFAAIFVQFSHTAVTKVFIKMESHTNVGYDKSGRMGGVIFTPSTPRDVHHSVFFSQGFGGVIKRSPFEITEL